MNARRSTLSVLAALCSLAGVLALACAPALAAKEYVHVGAFGEPCSGEPCGKGQFNEPSGVAVNVSDEPLVEPFAGDVYVIDVGDARVERFSATGVYLGQFDGAGGYESEGKAQSGPATPAGSFAFSNTTDANGVAVDGSSSPLDPSAGDVYVADVGHKAIDEFSAVGRYEGQLTGTCPQPGSCAAAEVIPFAGEILGVAVDPAGNVWLYESGHSVDEFSDGGAFVQTFATGRGTNPGFGVDADDDTYMVFGSPHAGERSSTGGVLSEGFGGETTTALAADVATSEVLLDEGASIERFRPIAGGEQKPLETFGGIGESYGLAVNGTGATGDVYAGDVYASERKGDEIVTFEDVAFPTVTTESASGVSETAATLHGTIGPEGQAVTECEFEYGSGTSYGQRVPCKQSVAEINGLSKGGAVSVPVSAELAAIQVRTAYDFRLSATNVNGTRSGANETFYTYGHPAIAGESVSSVGSSEATVGATIDPGGKLTGYRVQYGVNGIEEFTTPEASAGAGLEAVGVVVQLSGLRPGTTYRARVVADNHLGAAVGGELTFTTNKAQVATAPSESTCPNRTFSGFDTALPDCRAYELVSDEIDEAYVPPYGEALSEGVGSGEYIGDFGGNHALYEAAANGEAMTYMGGESNSGVGGSGGTGNGDGNLYLSTRGANGWKASDISIPVNPNYGASFEVFSEDLSVQLVLGDTPPGEQLEAEPKLLPECAATSATGIYSDDAGGLHALVTMNHGSGSCYGKPALISADDSHLLFEAAAPYTEEAKQAVEPAKNLYDSVGGVLRQVNVLPNGEVDQNPDASFGSIRYGDEYRRGSMIGAVSPDGSRIFWTEGEGEPGERRPKALYVRENDVQPQSPVVDGRCTVPSDACTVQLDAPQGGPGAGGGGFFWAAVDTGSRVFFTDCSRLTADSTAHDEDGCTHKEGAEHAPIFTGNDLYEYDFEKPVGERLVDLTVDHNPGDPLGADVQGVIGTSEDGSYVYLVAHGVLAGSNAEGKAPVAGQPNLYVLHDGETSFVVTLASNDDTIIGENGVFEKVGDWQSAPGGRTAQVSPSGDAVAFLSRLELTGYDNVGIVGYTNEINGKPAEPVYEHVPELFVYQAGTGRIACASCSPTGAPPSPFDVARMSLPGATVATNEGASFVPRWLVDREGTQAYFMSTQSLVADDNNGLMDVYEWQSDGSGGCQLASGCVSLISTAEPVSNAYLLDTAVNGRDVFFTSRSQLTRSAGGERVKVYDARVDGGRPEPLSSCTGTGCQGVPPAPPIFATPSSVTFNGVGNFEPSPPAAVKPKAKKSPCRRGFHREHDRCVRSKRKRESGSGKGSARKSAMGRGR